jgi:hypothetical protein
MPRWPRSCRPHWGKNGPPPTPQIGDVQTRRVTLHPMLEYFNNQAEHRPDNAMPTAIPMPR